MEHSEVKKEGRGYGYWILAILSSFFFLSTIILAALLFGGLAFMRAFSLEEEALKESYIEEVIEGTGQKKIAVIPIEGIIRSGPSSFVPDEAGLVENFKKRLENASNDAHVEAILLRIDSPGGGITASDIIYNELIKYKEEKRKKVVACMEDVAASGAYYVAVTADKIVAHPTTVTGSIGVIMPLINISELVKRYGIEDKSITSGPFKEIGNPLKPMSPEEEAVLRSIVEEMYNRFIIVVSKGRNIQLEDVRKLADGRIYTAQQALSLGLVDQIGYLSDAIKLTKEMAGLKEAKVIRYKKKWGIKDLLGLRANRPSITIESFAQDVPRLMYLWPGFHAIRGSSNNYFYVPFCNGSALGEFEYK
ncbi:MAG TPA: signal peptide peptidase SppA [Candidatus Hypogeohydataceae bacterium YC41]